VAAQTATVPAGAAGELLRRQQDLASHRETAPVPEPLQAGTSPAAAPSTGGTIHVTRVTFSPSHFLSPAELDGLAAPYLGRTLDSAEIDRLVAAINALYDARGIITARAILPPQTGDDGTLHIDLFEGKLGTLRIDGKAYIRESYLRHQARLSPGEVIDPTALRASLWRFNRLSDVQLRAALAPGDTPGLTDVTLTATVPKRDTLTVFVDNHAYGATGTYEGGALYRHSGLLGLDDRLSALFAASRGAVTGTASYDVPLGDDGTRFGLSYGHSVTRIIAGAYAAYGSKGIADSVNGELSQPLLATRKWLIEGTASSGYTHTRNYLAGLLLGTTSTARGALGLSVTFQGRTRAFSLATSGTWAHGEIDNGGSRADYALVSGSATFSQSIRGPFSFSANGAWQWASAQGLPSDLLFQIGGPTTVRGYTQGALAGDKGYFAEGQINFALPKKGGLDSSLFVFADVGHVTASFTQPNALHSIGVGASLRLGPRLGLETSLGHPLANRDLGPGKLHAYARLTWDIF